MQIRDRVLAMWKDAYLRTQEQIVAAEGTGALTAARILASRCAAAADQAEMLYLQAILRHCTVCASAGRLYGEEHPPEGTLCKACGGQGIRRASSGQTIALPEPAP